MKEKKPFLQQLLEFWGMKFAKPAAALFIIVFFVAFGSVGSFSKSVGNQEFFSYHISDIMKNLLGASSSDMQGAGHDFVYEEHLGGDLHGIAEGRNLIVVQVESFQDFLLNREYNGEEITPFLNSLITDGDTIYFDNYFMQVAMGNTSDAEFATNNSLYGTIEYCTYTRYETNHYRGLPVLLKEKGYDVAAFHGYKKEFWNREGAYPNLGFDQFYSEDDFEFEEVLGFGIRDDEFFEQSLDYMKEMSQPFYSFMVTLSHHHPFIVPADADRIEPLRQDEGTILYDYIVSARFTDRCIEEFIEGLKERDMYDNSVIVFYGDHFGLTASDEDIVKQMTRFLGKEYRKDEMAHIPLLIHIPGADVNQTVSISGGQMDFLPTIAYLLGFQELDTLYLGRNLLVVDSGFVAEYTYFPKGSFIRDDIIYIMGSDKVFENGEAWNMKTGEPVPLALCREDSEKSAALINLSEYYLKNDQIGKMLGERPRPPVVKVEPADEEEEEEPIELEILPPGAVTPPTRTNSTNQDTTVRNTNSNVQSGNESSRDSRDSTEETDSGGDEADEGRGSVSSGNQTGDDSPGRDGRNGQDRGESQNGGNREEEQEPSDENASAESENSQEGQFGETEEKEPADSNESDGGQLQENPAAGTKTPEDE